MQVAEVQGFAFALFSALICAYLINAHQRIFRAIAVCACLLAGALLATDQKGAAVASMLVAISIMFVAAGLAMYWECSGRWRNGTRPTDE